MKYLFRPDSEPDPLDISPKSHPEYAEMFARHNANYPRIKRPMYHLMIRLPKEIRPTREEFGQLAKDVMEGMGLGLNRPYLVVRHAKEEKELWSHIHIACSRIDYSGRIWYGRNDAKQAVALCRKLGKPELFQDVEPGYKDRDWGRDLTACAPLSRSETKLKQRTGVWLDKEHVGASLAIILRSIPRKGQAPLNEEFRKECEGYGITPRVVTRANGQKGLVYNFNGNDYRASSFGKVYTLNGLARHFRDRNPYPPEISLPPKSAVLSLGQKAFSELKKKGRRMEEHEKQELPEAAGLYEMARALKHCEFEDLRATGDNIDGQLSFKMMSKDVLNIYQVYVRLIYLDLQNRRQEQERMRQIRPTLIRIKPEELDATDEEYRERILPRIIKYSDQFTDKTTHANWRDSHVPGEPYPYKEHCMLRTFHIENQKKARVDAERRARELREEIETDKFNKLGEVRRTLYKFNKERKGSEPPLPTFQKSEYLSFSDTELKDERQKVLLEEYNQIRKRLQKTGVLIDADDRASEESWQREQARRAKRAKEREEAEQAKAQANTQAQAVEIPEAIPPVESTSEAPGAKTTPKPATRPVRTVSRSAAHPKPGKRRYGKGGVDR